MAQPDDLTPDLFCSSLLHGDSPPCLVRCSRLPLLTHYTRCLYVKPSQISGIVSAESGQYACSRRGRSTDQEKRKGEPEMFLGEENKALVRLFNEEFWNKGNLAAADELIEASAAIFLPGRGQVSLDDFKAFAASLRS